ncbi:hypothetical protein D3C81_1709970 [compost metagenome]
MWRPPFAKLTCRQRPARRHNGCQPTHNHVLPKARRGAKGKPTHAPESAAPDRTVRCAFRAACAAPCRCRRGAGCRGRTERLAAALPATDARCVPGRGLAGHLRRCPRIPRTDHAGAAGRGGSGARLRVARLAACAMRGWLVPRIPHARLFAAVRRQRPGAGDAHPARTGPDRTDHAAARAGPRRSAGER